MSIRILYVNGSEYCRKAELLLESSGLDYQRFVSKDWNDSRIRPPHLIATEGEFMNLNDIRHYVEMISKKSEEK